MPNLNPEKPRLLYLDDEKENLNVFKYLFRKDYEVYLAENGAQALEILAANDISLVIADQFMPGMTGVEFFEKTREDYPDMVRMILTGQSDIRAVIDAINRGQVYYYFKKPLNENEVRLVVAKAIESLELKRRVAASEKRFSSTFEQAAVGIVHLTPDGVFLLHNQRFFDQLGYTADELVGRGMADLLHPDDLAVVEGYTAELLAAKLASYNHEAKVLGRAGSYVWQNITVSLVRDQGGEPDYLIGVFEDISRRKQVELELTRHRQNLEAEVNRRTAELRAEIASREEANRELRKLYRAVEQSPVSVVITDPEGVIEYVNPYFTQVTGYESAEAVGANAKILKSGQQPPEFYRDLWDTIKAGMTWKGRFANLRKNGELFWENATISPVRDNRDVITHFVAVKEDITLWIKAEEDLQLRLKELADSRLAMLNMMEDLAEAKKAAEAATEAKSNFLANMSHEIRTPMNAVLGMTHLALATELTAKQHDYLTKIRASAGALLGVINDILDFSKIEADRLELETITFGLDEVLENVANLTGRQANDKGLELVFFINPELPGSLRGDPLRLGQVLVNLVSNAVKFSERGEVVVSVEPAGAAGERQILKFSVRDSGVGISPVQLQRLFKSFSQADSSTTRKYGGTGLGLSISRRLVELMGGEIHVESKPGEGSLFFFTAVFGRGEADREKEYTLPAELGNPRGLVVDGSRLARRLIARTLESFSLTVTAVDSGAAALAELSKAHGQGRPYDLILVDGRLCGQDGPLSCSEVLAQAQAGTPPVVLAMVAQGGEDMVRRFARETGVGYLVKPVIRAALFNTIMQALGREGSAPVGRWRHLEPGQRALAGIAGARVLVVEDNELNQQVAREMLESWAIRVTIADNGRQGVAVAGEDDFDLILMDIQMPELDGMAATREIRRLESHRGRVPIVAMTAHAMVGDLEKSIAAGMNDHITKPVEPGELFDCLVRWITPGDREVPAGLGMRPVGAEAVPFTELTGINVRKGLARMAGNREAYGQLLQKFQRNQGAVVREINAALGRGDREGARRLAHTLKGVAGNIGAEALFAAAAELEVRLRDLTGDAAEIAPALAGVEGHLREVIGAIAGLPEPAASAPEPALPGDPASVAGMFSRLAVCLKANDTAALGILGEIEGELRKAEELDVFRVLADLVRDYEFEAAQRKLGEVVEQLGITGEDGHV